MLCAICKATCINYKADITFVKVAYCWGELCEPHTSKSFIGLSFYKINNRKQIPNLTSSCAMPKLSIVSELYHTWSIDHQCHGKHVTKFSLLAIYGNFIISVTEACDKVLLHGHCYYGHLITSSGNYAT